MEHLYLNLEELDNISIILFNHTHNRSIDGEYVRFRIVNLKDISDNTFKKLRAIGIIYKSIGKFISEKEYFAADIRVNITELDKIIDRTSSLIEKYNIEFIEQDVKVIKIEKKDEIRDEIKIINNVIYNKTRYTFTNINENNIYEIPNSYHKFMDILLLNIGERVLYDEIKKSIGEDISDGTFKGNLLKLLRKNDILTKDEDIIEGGKGGYKINNIG